MDKRQTHTTPMREKIVALYGEDMLAKSVLSIRGGGGVLPEILGGGKYRTALEIGTYRGVGAAELSQYCERVITIDLKRGKLEYLREKHDRHAFWASLGIGNIDLRLIENDAEKAELVRGLEFDFALVDGAHDPTVRNDFELVKRCGTVLFHDYDDRGARHLNYVFDFVNTLPKEQLRVMDIFALWTAS